MSDCAADADLPLAYRDTYLDESFRSYIDNRDYSAQSFVKFLENIGDLIEPTFRVTGEVERAAKSYRDMALRSVTDATDVLHRAIELGKPAPFVFFACMQDATSALIMFAAAADQSVDDGKKAENLAAFSNSKPTDESTDSSMTDQEREASDQFQILFDATTKRVVAVLGEALEVSQLGGRRGAAARKALENSDQIRRLIEQAGSGKIKLSEGLRIIDHLESIGRRVAAAAGTRF